MDEFTIRNQIVSLIYDLFEKQPDKFAKMDDDTVTCLFDISSRLDLQNRVHGRLLELKIVRKLDEKSSLFKYTLYALGGGDIYFKYEVSELDSKTAYRFFEADHMLEKQQQDLELVRDTLLTVKGAA